MMTARLPATIYLHLGWRRGTVVLRFNPTARVTLSCRGRLRFA